MELRGTVVVVGMPRQDSEVTFRGFPLFSDEKKILGCMYGSAQVRRDFPRFVELVETGRVWRREAHHGLAGIQRHELGHRGAPGQAR